MDFAISSEAKSNKIFSNCLQFFPLTLIEQIDVFFLYLYILWLMTKLGHNMLIYCCESTSKLLCECDNCV